MEALQINRIHLPGGDLELAENIEYLAELYCLQGRFQESLPLFNEALSIRKLSLPMEHPSIGDLFYGAAEAYEGLGNYGEAERIYLNTLILRRRSIPVNYFGLACCLNRLSCMYQYQHRYDEALPCTREALDMSRLSLGKQNRMTMSILKNYLALLRQLGREPESKAFYNQWTRL